VALIASSCGTSTEPAANPQPAPPPETTTTTTTTMTADEAPAVDPNALDLDAYLVALINTTADWGDCAPKVERDLNDAQPDEPTEAYMLEYAQAYVGGHLDCWQGEHDAIAALQAPAEAAAAHAGLVTGRAAYLAAMRAGYDEAEIGDDYFTLLFDPPPLVVAAYIDWVEGCRAVEAVATSNGIDADLQCPMPPGGPPVQVTVTIEASDWSVEPSGVIEDTGGGVEITIVNQDDVAHRPMIIAIFSGSPAELPIVDGVLDLSRCGVSSDASDPSPPPAYFGCEYPEHLGDNVAYVIGELAPGESITVPVSGAGDGGTFVVIDHIAGAYDAGQYMVIEAIVIE
jgi:hypothetical protein